MTPLRRNGRLTQLTCGSLASRAPRRLTLGEHVASHSAQPHLGLASGNEGVLLGGVPLTPVLSQDEILPAPCPMSHAPLLDEAAGNGPIPVAGNSVGTRQTLRQLHRAATEPCPPAASVATQECPRSVGGGNRWRVPCICTLLCVCHLRTLLPSHARARAFPFAPFSVCIS